MKRITAMFMVAAACLAGPVPSRAATVNQLTAPRTSGVIRVRTLGELTNGTYGLQQGDGVHPQENPNRTVGDLDTACTPGSQQDDCYRALGPNNPRLNPSGIDMHTHYHVGDRRIVVNEVKSFRAGDTLMIGSPYCNTPYLGDTCRRYIPYVGFIDEQPNGEIVSVLGGDVAPEDHGEGVLELSGGLTRLHTEGEQVVKLPTAYTGQAMRVDVPNAAMFAPGAVAPLTVTAVFIPPQGSRRPWDVDVRRPLYKSWNEQNKFEQYPSGPLGTTSFFIPREITYTNTVGPSFDVTTPDTWYTVEVVAIDGTGRRVADGSVRYKLNPVMITQLVSTPPRAYQGEAVTTTGYLSDASSSAAIGIHVEDVKVAMTIKPPTGGSKNYKLVSCFDSQPGPKDRCGGDPFDSTYNNHGGFKVRIGGWRCGVDMYEQCLKTFSSRNETSTTGTYTPTVTVPLVTPAVASSSTTFEIVSRLPVALPVFV